METMMASLPDEFLRALRVVEPSGIVKRFANGKCYGCYTMGNYHSVDCPEFKRAMAMSGVTPHVSAATALRLYHRQLHQQDSTAQRANTVVPYDGARRIAELEAMMAAQRQDIGLLREERDALAARLQAADAAAEDFLKVIANLRTEIHRLAPPRGGPVFPLAVARRGGWEP